MNFDFERGFEIEFQIRIGTSALKLSFECEIHFLYGSELGCSQRATVCSKTSKFEFNFEFNFCVVVCRQTHVRWL